MSMEWQGKVAVVTGAGGTLCSVIAAFLAEKDVQSSQRFWRKKA